MKRTLLALVLCVGTAATAAWAEEAPPGASQAPAPGTAPAQQALADARSACASDIQTLCSGVQQGGGRILACLKQHREQVSEGCRQAVLKATQRAH